MKIHVLSDVHLEFGSWPREFPVNSIDADVTVLAGDIGVGLEGVDWALTAFERPVIYLNGNHEFYGGQRTVGEHIAEAREKCAGTHVHFLENGSAVIGGVRFLGATLWTDLALLDGAMPRSEVIERVWEEMTDYSVIDHGRRLGTFARRLGRRLTPKHTAQFHAESRAWLETELAREFDGRTVVVTHHAPSPVSLEHGRPVDPIDAAYASRLEYLMGDRAPLWIHGHTHVARDYAINGTRVVSNPRGYAPADLVPGFDPAKVVVV
jgi:predicted phosphodiesterase